MEELCHRAMSATQLRHVKKNVKLGLTWDHWRVCAASYIRVLILLSASPSRACTIFTQRLPKSRHLLGLPASEWTWKSRGPGNPVELARTANSNQIARLIPF